MKPILETPRLYLREFSLQDATHFYELNLNPNVIRYTGNTPFKDVNEAHEFLLNYKDYATNGYGRWAVIDKQTDEFLGWCGLKFDAAQNETDIGFRFFEEHWNKGYATESAKTCIDYGFQMLNLKEIIGRVMKENIASIKVLEKIGLVYEEEFEFDLHPGLIYKIKNDV